MSMTYGCGQSIEKSRQVAKWFETLPNVISVKPVLVTVNGVTYAGARYNQMLPYPDGCNAIRDGRAKPGDWYTRSAMYLLGTRPHDHRKVDKICFTLEGDSLEWHVSGYYEGDEFGEFAQHHPFGKNFCISPWDAPGKIDDHECSPYKRIPLIVEEV